MQNQNPVVLIVDDAETQRHLYRLLAEQIGITARVVQGCKAAMEALAATDFDVILTDWLLQDGDGLQCQRWIREKLRANDRPVPPIICITAKAMAGDREKCLAAGMDDYLAKPFTIEQLRSVLHKWLPMQ